MTVNSLVEPDEEPEGDAGEVEQDAVDDRPIILTLDGADQGWGQ